MSSSIDNRILELGKNFNTSTLEENLNNALKLIDDSIELSINDGSLPINTLVQLLSFTYPLSFLIDHLVPSLFDNSLEDKRLIKLSNNYSLQGKIKPGSKLLTLGKLLLIRIPKLIDNYKPFINLRNFIIESLLINDKLSISLDWHIMNNINMENYYISKKLSIYNNNNNNNNNGNIFIKYISLMNQFTKNTDIDMKLLSYIESIIKNIKNDNLSITPFNNYNKQFRWILNEEQFKQQLSNNFLNQSLKIQLIILLNWLFNLKLEKFNKLSTIVSTEYNKFRKPDIKLISNSEVLNKINSLISQLLKSITPELLSLLSINEQSFTKMKLKSFNNTFPKSTRITKPAHKFPKRNIKPPLFLKSIPKSSSSINANTLLDNIKDDIYFTRGSYESDPTPSNHQSLLRSSWKGFRCLKSSSNSYLSVIRKGINEDAFT